MTDNNDLDALAAELFHVFSRTEYALKASGFNNGDGEAKANWQSFAKAVEALIANPPSSDLRAAIDFILSAPPKKQMIIDGVITWQVVEPSTSSQADKLFQYVRRVRNNLFHGGKFNGHWFSPERSAPLLKCSLIVLRAAVEVVPKVRKAYHG